MAGWTNLTPSAGALAAGSAYLYEDAGALKYQGTSGSALTVANADGTRPGWTLISSSTLSTLSTVSFTSIPQTYTDLRVVVTGASSSAPSQISFRFGTSAIDTGSNYRSSYTTTGNFVWTAGSLTTSIIGGSTATSWGLHILDIPEYARTTGPKSVTGRFNVASVATGEIVHGTWIGNAIAYLNVITSVAWTGGNVYLYGKY